MNFYNHMNVGFFKSTFFSLNLTEVTGLMTVFKDARDAKRVYSLSELLPEVIYENISKIDINDKNIDELKENTLNIILCNVFIKLKLHNYLLDGANITKLEDVCLRNQISSKVFKSFVPIMHYVVISTKEEFISVYDQLFFSVNGDFSNAIEKIKIDLLGQATKDFIYELKKYKINVTNNMVDELLSKKEGIISGSRNVKLYERIDNIFINEFNYNFADNNNRGQGKIDDSFKFYIFNLHLVFFGLSSFEKFYKSNSDIKKFLDSLLWRYTDEELTHLFKVLMNLLKEKHKENYEMLISNQLPLEFLNLKEETYSYRVMNTNFLKFNHLGTKEKFPKIFSNASSLVFPKDEDLDKCLEGKLVFEKIINYLYPNDSKTILELFSNTNSIVLATSKRNEVVSTTLGAFLDNAIFRDLDKTSEKDMITFKYPNFFSKECILNRLYIQVYLMNQIDSLIVYSIFNKVFGSFFSLNGFTTVYLTNSVVREDVYNKLVDIIKGYGLETSLEYKDLYISCLLDFDIATDEEKETYRQLEQKGDAIFSLACNESLFYNNELETYTSEDVDKMICAKNQMKIAEEIGIDKLYLSSYLIDNPNTEYVYSKDIADSLEMVIGAISIEFGVSVAIKFTHVLLGSELNKPSKYSFEKYDLYYDKCFPSLATIDKDYNVYSCLESALTKFFKCFIYGNETLEKRIEINNINYSGEIFFSYESFGEDEENELPITYFMLEEYLHFDIIFLLVKYTNKIKLKSNTISVFNNVD